METVLELSTSDILSIALKRFAKMVEDDLGYSGVWVFEIPVPYATSEGILYAKGHFFGPPPYSPEERAVENVSKFTFFALEDPSLNGVFTIVVKHGTSVLATYLVEPRDLTVLSGDLPHV